MSQSHFAREMLPWHASILEKCGMELEIEHWDDVSRSATVEDNDTAPNRIVTANYMIEAVVSTFTTIQAQTSKERKDLRSCTRSSKTSGVLVEVVGR